MLDHLRLAIPVFPIYAVERGENNFYFEADLLSLGLNCAARIVKKDDDGSVKAFDLYAPYDTLGSDFSDMAVKFYDKGVNTLPYVELKASPLKLLQGHNIYGFESIRKGASEMIRLLICAFPKLCPYLDFPKTEVLHLDTTYMTSLPSQSFVAPALEFLSRVSNGHAKSQNVRYNNYVRWGVQNSRYIGRKAYGKLEEVENQIKQLQKKAVNDEQALKKLNALYAAKDFADGKLRFEARICKTYLVKNGYPSNLFELVKLQNEQPDLLKNLWVIAFKPIFDALKGENMALNEDDKVFEMLKSKLFTVTKSGNISYTKAINAYKFYKTLKSDGYESVKLSFCETASGRRLFYGQMKQLTDCGISKAYLQNLHSEKPKLVPFVNFIEIDFDNHLPSDYVEPDVKFDIFDLYFVA